MPTLIGRIVTITANGNPIDVCKFVRWRTVHTISPRLLPSSKIPVGWLQSHMWVEGEIGLQSYCPYCTIPPETDTTAVTLIVTTKTIAGVTRTFTFSNLIIATQDRDLGGEEPIFVFHFLAYSCTES